MSLALSFVVTVAVLPIVASSTTTVIPVSSDHLSSPWGTATATVAPMTTSMTLSTMSKTLLDLRGGGLFGGRKKKKRSVAQIYRESLEEQVLLLNQQLRQARTEVTTIRERAKKRRQNILDGTSSRARSVFNMRQESKEEQREKEEKAEEERQKQQEEERFEKERRKEQKETLLRLQGEIRQLEQMKDELEDLLETSANEIEELEEKLWSQESLTAELEESYKQKIIELETKLSDVQTTQLKKLTVLHQQKLDTAVKEALEAQEAEFRAKLEETTKRLTKEHAKEMEQEKLRSLKAVETERKKMRKLVRALALREKRLKLQRSSSSSLDNSEKEESTAATTTTTTTSVKSGSSSFNKPITPPTSRGTI